MATDRVTIELPADYAQDLYDAMLLRPNSERWSEYVIRALDTAGVRPSNTPAPLEFSKRA